MKAELDHKGTLVVSAETELEAYALKKWGDDHFNHDVKGEAILIVRHAPPKEPA